MPRLPGPDDVPQVGLRVTRRAIDAPAPSADAMGSSVYRAVEQGGRALSEFAERLDRTRAEVEVARAQVELDAALESVREAARQHEDPDTVADMARQRAHEEAQRIRGTLRNRTATRAYDAYALQMLGGQGDPIAGRFGLEMRQFERQRQVNAAVADVQALFDHAERTGGSFDVALTAADRLRRSGMMDEVAYQRLQSQALDVGSRRDRLAQAQAHEDRIYAASVRPDGSFDYGAAAAMAREIADPETRDAVLDRINARESQEALVERERRNDLVQSAVRHQLAGGRLATMPPEMRSGLEIYAPEVLLTMRQGEIAEAERAAARADRNAANQAREEERVANVFMQALVARSMTPEGARLFTQPGALEQEILQIERDYGVVLGADQIIELRRRQARVREEDDPARQTVSAYNTAWDLMEPILSGQFTRENVRDRDRDALEAQAQAYLMESIDNHVAAHGRAPTGEEVRQIVARGMQRQRREPLTVFGVQIGAEREGDYSFTEPPPAAGEAPAASAEAFPRLGPETAESAAARAAFRDVNGRDPTPGELARLLAD